jgi:type III secretory pathway component EscU
METLLTKTQKLIALVLGIFLIVVVALSTVDVGFLIAQDIWKPPRFLIRCKVSLRSFRFSW